MIFGFDKKVKVLILLVVLVEVEVFLVEEEVEVELVNSMIMDDVGVSYIFYIDLVEIDMVELSVFIVREEESFLDKLKVMIVMLVWEFIKVLIFLKNLVVIFGFIFLFFILIMGWLKMYIDYNEFI